MKLHVKEKEEEKKELKAEKKAAPVKAVIKKEIEKEVKAAKVEELRKTEVKKESGDEVTKAKKDAGYSAKDIFVLKGLEPVRKRPGMYIGSTGLDGLHHLIWEVVDNCIDESMAGYAKTIEVFLLADNRVRISDDGRGIPVEKHADTGKSALETVMTTLHAVGKFGGDAS